MTKKHDIALRWLAHDEPNTDEFNTFISALSAKNYDNYLLATNGYNTPAQNFNFAAKDGDIALRVNGKFPAKQNGDGRFLEWGDKTKNNWQHWIPKDQNPQIKNPERGFISSANQVSANKNYPYYFTGKFERYRNRIINDKLTQTEGWTIEDMKKMHMNSLSYKSLDYLDMLKKIPLSTSLSTEGRLVYDELLKWDGVYSSMSISATTFDIFYLKLEANTWDELLKYTDSIDIVLPEDWRLLELIQQDPNSKYFDIEKTAQKENAYDIISKSLNETADELAQRTANGQLNTWGVYKPVNIMHLTRVPAFSATDLIADGCTDAINAMGKSFGPSWRMIVSLENDIKAYAVYPGGQSGNPSSQYYSNMIEPWLKGEYFELNNSPDKEKIKKSAQQTITLTPKKKEG